MIPWTPEPGDRVRVSHVGEGGLPEVRYGWVEGVQRLHAIVLFDGELSPEQAHLGTIQPVEVTTVQLVLPGRDLLDDVELRCGLVKMWQAEADLAGLAVDTLQEWGVGTMVAIGKFELGEVIAGGEAYVLVAGLSASDHPAVYVRAEHRS